MNNLISMDKKYKTRDGRDVRILCTDIKATSFCVVALVDNTELVTYTQYGARYSSTSSCNYDLVEQPEEFSVWVEMFKSNGDVLSCSYETKDEMISSIKSSEECNNRAGYELLATKKITVVVGETCL